MCHKRAAFTLIELLVAMAVLALLVLMLGEITNRVTTSWVQNENQTERQQNARAIADFISNDLKGALLPLSIIDQNGLQFVRNPAGVSTEYLNADALFWQAPIATDNSKGDIAEVGYFVKWFTNDDGQPVARLCRFYADATDPNFLIYSNPKNWINDTLISLVAPGDKSQTPSQNYRGFFAENVIGLWARCLSLEGGTEEDFGDFDSRQAGATALNGEGLGDIAKLHLPSQVEISVAVIDSHSAARVTSAVKENIQRIVNSSKNGEDFLKNVEDNTDLKPIFAGLRVYTTTVYLQNFRTPAQISSNIP